MNNTTDPLLKSFIEVPTESHFPIQNLPYGVFKNTFTSLDEIGVAIGEFILNLRVIEQEGFFKETSFGNKKVFSEDNLNLFMSLGKKAWSEARQIISDLLSVENLSLRDNKELREKAFIKQTDVKMVLPVNIGDYTDFYSSKYHATNVGTMFRGRKNALNPNWLHLPVGYHGRASSIVISGTDVKRPKGQIKRNSDTTPIFGACERLDFELEMGYFVGPGNKLGEPISIENAEEHLFGLVLVNDWSARDIQKWEYVPLGPFNAKNFITSISPWVVTLEALEPFRIAGEIQKDPEPLPYLKTNKEFSFDIKLEVLLNKYKISESNFKYMYWTMDQQLVHHTITGCNLRSGDLLASGTISGPNSNERGCMLELSWDEEKGSVPLKFPNGEERTFLEDDDEVVLTGYAQGKGYKIGFGSVSGKIISTDSESVN